MSRMVWMAFYDLKGQLRERGTFLIVVSVLVLACFGLHQGKQLAGASVEATAAATAQQASALARAKAYTAQFFADPTKPENASAKSYKNPADIRGYAFREYLAFAVKPALPGAALAIGQSDVLPAYVRVKVESMDSARTHYEIEHPARLASGRFDLSFVALYLWPLALLTLCLSALTHDRETMRIKTLAIEGVSPLKIVVTQVAARAFAASVFFAFIMALLALISGAVPMNAEGFSVVGQWCAVTLAYSAFWAGVCVLIGASCHSRATAAFAAFGAWLIVAVLLPNVIAAAVTSVAPVPSREAYIVAARDAADAVNSDRQNMVARFYDQHPEWRLEKTAIDKISPTVTRLARAIELEEKLAQVDAKFISAKRKQLSLIDRASVFSPVNLAQHALASIAGNDLARHERFMSAVRSHQLKLREFMQGELQRAAKRDETAPCPNTCVAGFGFTAHDRVPTFVASADLQTSTNVGTEPFWLVLWAALLSFAAAWILRSHRVSRALNALAATGKSHAATT